MTLNKFKEIILDDLDFIRKHVREWPEGATGVRLIQTGEIKFEGVKGNSGKYDFYPDWYSYTTSMPSDGDKKINTVHTKSQWNTSATYPEWTIFNNTLPLKQLNAHQRGELFNHWMINKTESMTFLYSGVFTKVNNALWSEDAVYRAKPSVALTERQLFLKEAKHYESVEDMFDSGKFKLVDKIPEKKYTFTNKVVYINIV